MNAQMPTVMCYPSIILFFKWTLCLTHADQPKPWWEDWMVHQCWHHCLFSTRPGVPWVPLVSTKGFPWSFTSARMVLMWDWWKTGKSGVSCQDMSLGLEQPGFWLELWWTLIISPCSPLCVVMALLPVYLPSSGSHKQFLLFFQPPSPKLGLSGKKCCESTYLHPVRNRCSWFPWTV